MKKISHILFNNEDELESFVFENLDNYFSKDRIFISDKKKLITKTGTATLPDGLLLDIEKSKLCFIENELLEHGVFAHIVKQIIKFLVAYKNIETKKKLRELFLDKIREDKKNYLETYRKYYPDIEEIDISGLIESIIAKDPELYIFIDKIDEDLKDVCLILQDNVNIKAIMVLKLKRGDKINYAFYDEEFLFIRGESQPIKETKASEKYWNIFDELIEKFKTDRPGSTRRGSSRDSYLGLPVGTTGIHLEWDFIGREPDKKLFICLDFENVNSEVNHSVFEFFSEKESEFKLLFEENIIFEKFWLNNGKWSSIRISKEVETLDNFKTNDTLKKWALENMLKLYDFYMKYTDDVKSIINEIKSK